MVCFCSGEFQVTSRPDNPIDYEMPDSSDEDQSGGHSGDNSSIARIVIIATAVLGVLLIIVLCAILCESKLFQTRFQSLFVMTFIDNVLILNR